MNKKQILKIIKKESFKLEEKYSLPLDISWDDIEDDNDETHDVVVELAYNCMRRIHRKS